MGSNLFSSMVITLREGIEGALAVAIVFLYLRKTGRLKMASAVWWGLAGAIVASIAGAVVIERIAINSEIFEGILMFAAAVFVGTMILWMPLGSTASEGCGGLWRQVYLLRKRLMLPEPMVYFMGILPSFSFSSRRLLLRLFILLW